LDCLLYLLAVLAGRDAGIGENGADVGGSGVTLSPWRSVPRGGTQVLLLLVMVLVLLAVECSR